MGIEVRPARPSDAEALAKVHVASWQEAYRGAFPDSYLDGLDWKDRMELWERQVADPALSVLVAEETGTLLGLASFGPPRDREFRAEVCWELYALYLDPGHWGQGIGSALMDAVIAELPDRIRTLVLWVLAGNDRATGFYERQGFRPDGARRPIERGEHAAVQVRYRRTLSRR